MQNLATFILQVPDEMYSNNGSQINIGPLEVKIYQLIPWRKETSWYFERKVTSNIENHMVLGLVWPCRLHNVNKKQKVFCSAISGVYGEVEKIQQRRSDKHCTKNNSKFWKLLIFSRKVQFPEYRKSSDGPQVFPPLVKVPNVVKSFICFERGPLFLVKKFFVTIFLVCSEKIL